MNKFGHGSFSHAATSTWPAKPACTPQSYAHPAASNGGDAYAKPSTTAHSSINAHGYAQSSKSSTQSLTHLTVSAEHSYWQSSKASTSSKHVSSSKADESSATSLATSSAHSNAPSASSKTSSAGYSHSSSSATKTFDWPKATSWIDWKTYKSNGVNVGSWLEQEFNQDTDFWQATAADYADEWTWCEGVGFDVCGPILEERYANWITTDLIDKLAAAKINTLRIPLTYAAFTRVPSSWLYSGNQLFHLRKIMNHAIEKHDMHIIVSLHSLPGGYNTLQIGEAFGHNNWWFNQTLLEYSWKAVEGALDFIVSTGHKDRVTFSPSNEASDNFAGFGSPAGLTDSGMLFSLNHRPAANKESGVEWLFTYLDGVVERIAARDSRIPMLFQDNFSGMERWSSKLEQRYPGVPIVISTHNYWFAAAGAYSNWLDPAICGQAEFNTGDGKYPVFIGEWSLQTAYNNTLAGRKNLFDRQRWAFQHYTSGGAFWTAKFDGLDAVDGESTQRDYWSYERLIDQGVVEPMPANISYCE
jgi:hypothetical protein